MSLISKNTQYLNNILRNDENIFDEIYPSYIDMKNPKYLIIDDMYVGGLLVIGYNTEIEGGFLNRLLESDIDINLSIFYEKQNTYEAIKELTYYIGCTGAEIKTTKENQIDTDIMSNSYQDAKYIRKKLQVEGEELYYIYTYINIYSKSLEELENDIKKVEGISSGIGLKIRRGTFRQDQVFFSCLPIMQNNKYTKELTKRNVLTEDLISTYPFLSSEVCDKDGIVIGVNELNNSLVMIDRFDSEKYKNANMCVIGTSGSGKSYFIKLMVSRNRCLSINQYIIDPDREYEKLCEVLNGTIIKFGGAANINVMDIRESSLEEDKGYLQNKLGKLNAFFEIIFKDMSLEEKSILEEKIIKCYENKGITHDDNSLYKENKNANFLNKRVFKESSDMPILQDLYDVIRKDKKIKRLSILLKPYINGSMKFLNNYTNVELSNKIVISDIYDIEEENLAPIIYIITELYWDKIKEDRSKKKIIYLDEIWRLISANSETANFVFKMFKTIRKYGRSSNSHNSRHK